MGTKAGTLHDEKVLGEARAEAACIAQCKVITTSWDKTDREHSWKAINLTIDFLEKNHNQKQIRHYWQSAWGFDSTSKIKEGGDNHGRTLLISRIHTIARHFDAGKGNPTIEKLYEKYHNKCGIHRIYEIITNEEKKKGAKLDKRGDKTNKEVEEEAEAFENVGNKEAAAEVRNRAAAANKPKIKQKEDTKGWTAPTPNLDREWKKQTKDIIMNDPLKYYRTIISFAEMQVLSEEWGDLANKEIAKLT
jgi:hypothetical protein